MHPNTLKGMHTNLVVPHGTNLRSERFLPADLLSRALSKTVAFLQDNATAGDHLYIYDDWWEHDGLHLPRKDQDIDFGVLARLVETPEAVQKSMTGDNWVFIGVAPHDFTWYLRFYHADKGAIPLTHEEAAGHFDITLSDPLVQKYLDEVIHPLGIKMLAQESMEYYRSIGMHSYDTIHENFRQLYGQPCYNVTSGYGSSLTLEFGEPWLSIREPQTPSTSASPAYAKQCARRIVTVRGHWHLWIYFCEWQVFTGNKRIGHSNLKGSSKLPVKRAVKELDGQKLTRIFVDPEAGISVFEFDLGSRLEARPADAERDQWVMYGPTSIFVLHGDFQHSSQLSKTRPIEQTFLPGRTQS